MSIERNLRKLQAADPKPGDKVPSISRPSLALGQREGAPTADADFQRLENELFKSSGAATLGLANDFGGMPQRDMEVRTAGWSVIPMGNVSGSTAISVEHAQKFYMTATAPLTLTFDTDSFPEPYERSGIDIEFLVMIKNPDGHAVTIAADHWAPFDEAPDLSRAGFYEILIAVMIVPDETLIRAYPAIQPPLEA